jgi:hypothetical protein
VQVLGQQEQQPEEGDVHREKYHRARGHRRVRQQRDVEQRLAPPELHPHEQDAGGQPHQRRGQHDGIGPAGMDAVDQREHDHREGDDRQAEADEIKRRRTRPPGFR